MWFAPLLGKLVLTAAAALALGCAPLDDFTDDDPPQETIRRPAADGGGEWTCIVPFFNEAATIDRCLSSLARQSRRPIVVLVDNGSTDGGQIVAEGLCADHGLRFISLFEQQPGKVAALAAGLARTETTLVATCDADTFYPPDYLARASRLLGRESSVAAGALLITKADAPLISFLQRGHRLLAATAAPWQCHTGGAGQVFRADALRQIGGFSTQRWNFVLEDHEVIARLSAIGHIAYDVGFWCSPLVRPARHSKVGWTLGERVCYHMTMRGSMPAYFESFLAPRLLQRQQWNTRLRPVEIA